MQPDIPWNVAGISSDAREAARAAARREGLSVGEWLTRRILRSFADGSADLGSFTPGGWSPPEERPSSSLSGLSSSGLSSSGLSSAPQSREADDVMARMHRAESEANQISRRIEEQLRNVARRLDSTERGQSESNRAMSKAATEMNVAAREQAQAFDQLGGHVVGLSERLRKLERNANNEPLKDAVKQLHTGLSRLAEQIGQTTGQSSQQISALAANLDAVVSRIGETRNEAEHSAHMLEEKFASLSERLSSVERIAESSANTLERTLDSIEARQASRKDEESEYKNRIAANANTIARLEDTVAQLQTHVSAGPDPVLDRRLQGIEHTLGSIASRIESDDDGGMDERIRALAERIEQSEHRHNEALAELRTSFAAPQAYAAQNFPGATPAMPAAAAPPAMHLGVNPAFAAQNQPAGAFGQPGYASQEMYDAPPPFPENDYNTVHFQGGGQFADNNFQNGQFPGDPNFANAAAAMPNFDAPPGFVPDQSFGVGEAFNLDLFANQAGAATDESYLAAMRRQARAASAGADAGANRKGSFSWGTSSEKTPSAPGKTRYLLLIVIGLIAAVAVIAGVFLSQKLATPSATSDSALFPKSAATTPVGNELLGPGEQTNNNATPIVPPLEEKVVRDAPIKAIPGSPRIAAPTESGKAVSSLDRLTQMANAGNAKAELVVGLKYLDGDGVPVNEGEAAKWLTRAAEKGEPMAQYRLGTLYERGKGVSANPATAQRWYQAAAQQGNRKAMHNLAVAYAEGSGAQKNFAEAARWFSKAANLGLADSQFNLAVLYERGLGVPQSLLDAYKWYAIAASQGDAESKNRIGAIGTQLSPDDKAAAERAASSFKPAALNPRGNVAPTMQDIAR